MESVENVSQSHRLLVSVKEANSDSAIPHEKLQPVCVDLIKILPSACLVSTSNMLCKESHRFLQSGLKLCTRVDVKVTDTAELHKFSAFYQV